MTAMADNPPPRMDVFGIRLLRLLGRLPCRALWGRWLGFCAYYLLPRRRRIARTNIRMALPHLPPRAQRHLLRRHFTALGVWLANGLWTLTATPSRFAARVRIVGTMPAGGILLTPHFLGMDIGLLALCLRYAEPNTASGRQFFYYYKPQRRRSADTIASALRDRFGARGLSTKSRQSFLHGARRLREGHYVCYLPDIDPKQNKHMAFVPFLAVEQTATLTAVSHLAKLARTLVVPIITCQNDGSDATDGGDYTVHILPPLAMSGDATADAATINATISSWVRRHPHNYYWLHRRFKTRPHPLPSPYA